MTLLERYNNIRNTRGSNIPLVFDTQEESLKYWIQHLQYAFDGFNDVWQKRKLVSAQTSVAIEAKELLADLYKALLKEPQFTIKGNTAKFNLYLKKTLKDVFDTLSDNNKLSSTDADELRRILFEFSKLK